MRRRERKARASALAASYRGYSLFQAWIETLLPSSRDRIAIDRPSGDAGSGGICCGCRQLPARRSWHVTCVYSRRTHDLHTRGSVPEEGDLMLWTIFVILLVLWALGMVSSYTLGGFIHLLLLIAIAVVLIRIIQGRRPV
jgi:hypothetical protein